MGEVFVEWKDKWRPTIFLLFCLVLGFCYLFFPYLLWCVEVYLKTYALFHFSWNFSGLNVLAFQGVGELNRSLKLAYILWSAYLCSCAVCISELLPKSQCLCSLQVLTLNLSVQALSDRKTKYFYNSESYWPNWESVFIVFIVHICKGKSFVFCLIKNEG